MGDGADEFRVQMGDRVFGPVRRADVVSLRDAGRIGDDDRLRVGDGPWIRVGDFFTQPDRPEQPTSEAPRRRVAGDGQFRILRGELVYGPLQRGQLEQLHQVGRLTDDDIVCLPNGRWVDYRAALRTEPPPPPTRQRSPDPEEPLPGFADLDEDDFDVEDDFDQDAGVELDSSDVEIDELAEYDDDWQVIVRGVPSARMEVRHIRQLFVAREITLHTPIRHRSWGEADWVRVEEIPQVMRGLGLAR